MCILLLKISSHYDLSVLSMSDMGFQKSFDRGVGGVSSIHFLGDFFQLCKAPN